MATNQRDESKFTVEAWGESKNPHVPGAERKEHYESDAKLLAGKEKREMEAILKRGVARDAKVNEARDKALEEQADTLPKDKIRSGVDVITGPAGILRKMPWEN